VTRDCFACGRGLRGRHGVLGLRLSHGGFFPLAFAGDFFGEASIDEGAGGVWHHIDDLAARFHADGDGSIGIWQGEILLH